MKTCRLLIVAAMIAGFLGVSSNAWAQEPSSGPFSIDASVTVGQNFTLAVVRNLVYGSVTPGTAEANTDFEIEATAASGCTTTDGTADCSDGAVTSGHLTLTASIGNEIQLTSDTPLNEGNEASGGQSCTSGSTSDTVQLHDVDYGFFDGASALTEVAAQPAGTHKVAPTSALTDIYVGAILTVEGSDDPASYTCTWNLTANNT